MAAQKTGPYMASVGNLTDIDTVARNPVGTRVPGLDADGHSAEWIYLSGVASLAANDWIVYYGDGSVARMVSTPLPGLVAVSMAAILAINFGWYQILGITPATTNIGTDASGDKKALYQGATAGQATTTAAATKAVFGAWAFGNPASNVGKAIIEHPYCVGNATI